MPDCEPNNVRLSLNEKVFSRSEGELPFTPGRSNVLEVKPNWQRLGDRTLEAVVKKLLPDGTCETLRAQIQPPGGHSFDLGPMTAPPVYEFEAGVVYRRGYGIEISLVDVSAGQTIESTTFGQGLSAKPLGGYNPIRNVHRTHYRQGVIRTAGPERFIAGQDQRLVYNPLYGIESALALQLSDEVLRDQNAVRVMCRLNSGACVERLDCQLEIADADGKQRLAGKVELSGPGESWTTKRIEVSDWPEGDYEIALYPILDNRTWREGPRIVYRRRPQDDNAVRVSPFAPWTLQRDTAREEMEITDFKEACSKWADKTPAGWTFVETDGRTALVCPAGTEPEPVELRLPVRGHYAVYMESHADGCLIQISDQGLIRPSRQQAKDDADHPPYRAMHSGVPPDEAFFVWAGDLSDSVIRVFAFDTWLKPTSGLAYLKLVPVTQASVETFYRETSNPPTPMYGVSDWTSLFADPSRLSDDQIDTIIGAQAELGLRTIDWEVGRAVLEYHSELPGVTLMRLDPSKKYDWAMAYMIHTYRPLVAAYTYNDRRSPHVQIWPWLCMNRHYGIEHNGGQHASDFYLNNPQWWRREKDGRPPSLSFGGICYFFPEVRQERIDILLEVARKGGNGLLVGCCRQVPMLLYNPEMVAAYTKETGIDPRRIDSSDTDEYTRWITWRADHFTQLLRDLKKALGPIRKETGRAIPVAVRIPPAGLRYNIAQGLDVAQWLREGLVDQLQLDPLENSDGEAGQDVRPYVKLARQHGVRVIGGLGSTWAWSRQAYVPAMHRVLALMEGGVDGIEIYETELLALCSSFRWLVPLFGNGKKMREFLANSNIEACYPISATSAMFGHDNHSKWTAQPLFEL